MWGTHAPEGILISIYRFIPTRVGNSAPCKTSMCCPAVHPHACGELFGKFLFFRQNNGSSPRVWGTLGLYELKNVKLRFIPTRVGNSQWSNPPDMEVSVHPHACGELVDCYYIYITRFGSSPRVWGTPVSMKQFSRNTRFIPTRVGNSIHRERFPRTNTVHPHACGEL